MCDLLFPHKNGYPKENGDSILEYEDPKAPKMGVWYPFSLTVDCNGRDEYCSPMTMNSNGGDDSL